VPAQQTKVERWASTSIGGPTKLTRRYTAMESPKPLVAQTTDVTPTRAWPGWAARVEGGATLRAPCNARWHPAATNPDIHHRNWVSIPARTRAAFGGRREQR